MDKTFKLTILTPEATFFEKNVVSIVAPGYEGYLGVLAGHAPMLCELKKGNIRVKDEAGESTFTISGGYLLVSREGTSVMATTCER